jgi:hypothetical protein
VKFSLCRLQIVALASLAALFLISTPSRLRAQSPTLAANRALVSTGNPAPPPGARKSRQVPTDATASIDPGTGPLVTISCHKGSFERVGLRHDQTVDVAVQYSTAGAGQAITVEALDGGQIIAAPKRLIVGSDGAIHFKFRVGHQPGIYQVALHNGAQELGLQFWVTDEANPRNNPPVINAGN